MIKVLHVITDLGTGGAEGMLIKLVGELDASMFAHTVVSLRSIGPSGEKLRAMGVEVQNLDLSGAGDMLRGLKALKRIIDLSDISLVQTWLYHADLLGGLAAKSKRVPVVWNIRHSKLEKHVAPRATRLVGAINSHLSYRIPDRILCCSQEGYAAHASMGFCRSKMLVIPNGFDLKTLSPDPEGAATLRREWNIPDNSFVIGCVGRYHPIKDHATLIRAVAVLAKQHPELLLMLVGEGLDSQNVSLGELIRSEGLAEHTMLLGKRTDLRALNTLFDVAVSSSVSEGFPNAIGEAMACATPCAVTIAGDSAFLVGDTGTCAPPQDPQALSTAIERILTLTDIERLELGKSARERIVQHFDIRLIAQQYADVYRSVSHA